MINNGNSWRVEVNDREFHIKGVVGNNYLEKVKEYGGNSIRTGWQKDQLDYIPPLEPFNPKVWDAVNQAAKAIHEIDPDHPVMTVIGTSMMHKVTDIVKRCPDIDLLGINTYGDIYTLQDTLNKYGWFKPYVITEWGPDGYWEVRKTPWKSPYEQTGLFSFCRLCLNHRQPSGVHTLKLVKTGINAPVITDIRVYNPYIHK